MEEQSSASGVVVTCPRESDAIGGALRHAFTRHPDLPDDLLTCLSALDRLPTPRA